MDSPAQSCDLAIPWFELYGRTVLLINADEQGAMMSRLFRYFLQLGGEAVDLCDAYEVGKKGCKVN